MFWGLNYVIAEKLFQNKIGPIVVLGVEMLVGAITFLTIGWWNGQLQKGILSICNDRHLLFLMFMAVVSMTVGNLMIAMSIESKNATLAGLIEVSYPIFIVLASFLLFGDNHFTPSVFVGGSLIFTGVFVIYWYS